MTRTEANANTLVRWLEAATSAGRLRITDIPLAAKLFWAMASGALFWPAVFEGPIEPEDSAYDKEAVYEANERHSPRHGTCVIIEPRRATFKA